MAQPGTKKTGQKAGAAPATTVAKRQTVKRDALTQILEEIQANPAANFVACYKGTHRVLGWASKNKMVRKQGVDINHLQVIEQTLRAEIQPQGTYEIRYMLAMGSHDYTAIEYEKTTGRQAGRTRADVIHDGGTPMTLEQFQQKGPNQMLVEYIELKTNNAYLTRDLADANALIDQLRAQIEQLEMQVDLADEAAEEAAAQKKGLLQQVMDDPEKYTGILNAAAPFVQPLLTGLQNLLSGAQAPQQPLPPPPPQNAHQRPAGPVIATIAPDPNPYGQQQ